MAPGPGRELLRPDSAATRSPRSCGRCRSWCSGRHGSSTPQGGLTPGEPCLQRMSALSRRNWSCGTQSPQRRVGGYRDTDSLFWLWAKANKQRLDLLLCLWAAAAAAEQTAYRGVNAAPRLVKSTDSVFSTVRSNVLRELLLPWAITKLLAGHAVDVAQTPPAGISSYSLCASLSCTARMA